MLLAIIGAKLKVNEKTLMETAICGVVVSLIMSGIGFILVVLQFIVTQNILGLTGGIVILILGLVMGVIINALIVVVGYLIGEPLANIQLSKIIKKKKQEEQKSSEETL